MMDTPVLKLEHSDARGEIYSITLPGDKELMLLHSHKGTLRGGHSHTVDETVVILTGRMRYYKKNGTDESKTIQKGGDASFNPAGMPHMGEFLEDTWLIEWKIDTDKNSWENIDDKAWRARVNTDATSRKANT